MQLVDAAATAESVAAVVVFAAIRAPATNPSSPPWPPPLPAVLRPRRRLAATASLVHALLVFASFLAWSVKSLTLCVRPRWTVREHSEVYI